MDIPLINGRAYSWADLDISIGRTSVVGVTAVSYDDEQVIEDNYGRGKRVVSRGYGNVSTTGSITLHMSEIEALQDASTTGRLQDLGEFDILVSYQPTGGKIINHKLKNCRFKNNGRAVSQGDTLIEKELELIVGSIDWKA